MSASLVGSEMCIRDRCNGSRNVRCGGVHVNVNAKVTDNVNAHVADTAVSYTHLTLPTICSV
eukprot:10683671-Alexandrium_andersonii.AAC.1